MKIIAQNALFSSAHYYLMENSMCQNISGICFRVLFSSELMVEHHPDCLVFERKKN